MFANAVILPEIFGFDKFAGNTSCALLVFACLHGIYVRLQIRSVRARTRFANLAKRQFYDRREFRERNPMFVR